MSANLRNSSLLILFLFSVFLLFTNSVAAQTCDGDFIPGEVTTELTSTGVLQAVAMQYNLDPNPIDQLSPDPIYRLRILDGVSPCVRAAQMRADAQARVVAASPNFNVKPPEGSGIILWSGGPYHFKSSAFAYKNQWAISNINLPQAHQSSRGANVIVAVLDTGIDRTHPAFVDQQTGQSRLIIVPGSDLVDNDNDPSEVFVSGSHAYGHGTHAAGIIALVAPQAKILPIRVLNSQGIGDDWKLVKALRLIAAYNPTGDNIKVFNMSFTEPDRSDLVESVLHKTVKRRTNVLERDNDPGIVAVVSAGNNSSNVPHFPAGEAAFEGAILSVAGYGPNNNLLFFSNFPPASPQPRPPDWRWSWVNLMGPGYRIISAMPGGRYGTWSGTSMASPFAAGVAALVISKYPMNNNNFKAEDVACHIIMTGFSSGSVFPPRLNANAAVTSPQRQCITPDPPSGLVK